MDYQRLITENTELFNNSNSPIKIITDFERIREWQDKRRANLLAEGKPLEWADIGVVLNDPYIIVIRDLVEFPGGHVNGYFRVISRANLHGGQGVVILPKIDNKYLLLHLFRHPTRSWSYELPRGFGEPKVPARKQAEDEIWEEVEGKIEDLTDLGIYHSNTGVEASSVRLFYAKLKSVGKLSEEEGIENIIWVTLAEIEEMIATEKITDGFTIAAYTRAKLRGLLG